MTDTERESTRQVNGALKYSEPLVNTGGGNENFTAFANGIKSKSGDSFAIGSSATKELRTEEAELAAVIAKVTGRANPFVNESDCGERKFTILCGEAACQENECANEESSALSVKKKVFEEKRVISVGVIEFNKPVCSSSLNIVEKEAVVPHTGSLNEKNPGPKPAQRTRRPKKDDNANTLEGKIPIVYNHISDESPKPFVDSIEPVKCDSNALSKTCLEEYECSSRKTVGNEIPADSPVLLEKASADEKFEDALSVSAETPKVEHASNVGLLAEEISHVKLADMPPSNESAVVTDASTRKTFQASDKPLAYGQPTREEDSNCDPEEGSDTKVTEEESKSDPEIVKACFPSVKPKIPSKIFVVNSPEIQQNIINRRAAARNVTSIAEFEPLVTVSPEAEKLALWKRPNSADKPPLASPELAPSCWTPPDSSDGSPEEGTERSPGSRTLKDSSCCIPKDLRKQILHQKSSEKKTLEEELNNNNKRKDSERGNDDNNNENQKDPIDKKEPKSRPWLVPLILLVFISAAITIIVLIVKFKPWMLQDQGTGSTASTAVVDSQKDNLEEPSANALQQILKELNKMKALPGVFIDTNTTDDLFDSNLMVTENGLPVKHDGAEGSEPEMDNLHNDTSENPKLEISGRDRIVDKLKLISLLTEAPPKIAKGICSSFDDQETVNMCSKLRPSVLKLVLKYMLFCQKEGDILLADYIKMYRYINSFVSSFGGFAAVQTKMLEERIRQMEAFVEGKSASEYEKLFQMVYSEITSGTVANIEPFSGTVLFTCLHRHLEFLTLALENALQLKPEDPLQLAFEPAYQEVLSRHHSWFVKIIYEVGMSSLITVEQAAALLSIRQVESFTEDELRGSLEIIVKQLKSLNQYTEDILKKSNALRSIPKEVIT